MPPLLKPLKHTFTFLTRKPEHYQGGLSTEKHAVFKHADSTLVTETKCQIQGVESLETYKHIVCYRTEKCVGEYVAPPIDNACYLGHAIVHDAKGLNARLYAEEALNQIILSFDNSILRT